MTTEKILVQINFTIPTIYGDFSDAIYKTMEEYDAMTPEELEALKQERVNNWVKIIKDSQQVQENTEEVIIDVVPEVLEPEVI